MSYQDAIREAFDDARSKDAGRIERIAESRGIETKKATGEKWTAKVCPWCKKKGKLGFWHQGGKSFFKCPVTSCAGNTGGDEIAFIELVDGVDRKTAIRTFLSQAGVEHPWDRLEREKEQRQRDKKTSPSPTKAPEPKPATTVEYPDNSDTRDGVDAPISLQSQEPKYGFDRFKDDPSDDIPLSREEEESDDDEEEDEDEDNEGIASTAEEKTHSFIRIPQIDKTPHEAIWEKLILTDAHRQELRTKRGFDDAWIDALGFKSATRANRGKLDDILDLFPPNELLRSGLVLRGQQDQKLRIADVLHGRVREDDENGGPGEWVDREIIIIPYINAAGRIIGLRPHKRSLSNAGWRETEEASDFYEKLNHNLRIPFGEPFLLHRPEQHKHRCVICEGEMKAAALRRCGIPAIGFQGIHYFRQNKEFTQAIQDVVRMLREQKIREVVVIFDNEDKSHKPFQERFEAETMARYTALELEDKGFVALFGMLPDDWREGGEQLPDGRWIKQKADWDGRLAWHVRRAKGDHEKGIAAATQEFEKFLRDRKGKQARVRTAPRQVDYLDAKEDVINQAMHKLRHEPKIFIGGRSELNIAAEIDNWCLDEFRHELKVNKLAELLRETHGGYYIPKPPPEKLEEKTILILKKVTSELAEAEDLGGVDEDQIRRLKATRMACYTILYKYPKPFTDFTAEAKYKILVQEQDGTTRSDRLIVFRDKNGIKSHPVQMPPKLMGSSQNLRIFFLSCGGYHWKGNQDECDAWVKELDVGNYQRTIVEIPTYGWDKEKKLYILGDCAVAPGGKFLFPDKQGIIWHNGLGYRNAVGMESTFCHQPPILFPGAKNAKAAYEVIDWEKEREEVAVIWAQLLQDMHDSFGGYAGFAAVAAMIQYLSHPEILSGIGGKPGFWIQGEKGSGKTQTLQLLMKLVGYPPNYGIISLGSTKVGIERNLSQFCGLPVHIDEWRNARADETMLAILTNAYNEIGISKGTNQGSKATRKSVASTIPVVTGEDAATDPALRSRYLRLVMAKASRHGTALEQAARFAMLRERSNQYHRIGRFLFKHREQFAKMVVESTQAFARDERTLLAIPDPRASEVIGINFSAISVAQALIGGEPFHEDEAGDIRAWFLKHGADSCTELESDVFKYRFFTESVNMIARGVLNVNKYIRVRHGNILPDGSLNMCDMDPDEGRPFVLIAASELFDEYKRDKSARREDAPIDRRNILAELKAEKYWVKNPDKAPHVHRYTIKGSTERRTWWVLDFNQMDETLRGIFRPIYESEAAEASYALDEHDKLIDAKLQGRLV